MSIGNNIKKYRKLAHMTQVQLAEKINRSESTIRKYEANNIIPDFLVLDAIAKVLGVTRLKLITENDIETKKDIKIKELSDYSTEELLLELVGRCK